MNNVIYRLITALGVSLAVSCADDGSEGINQLSNPATATLPLDASACASGTQLMCTHVASAKPALSCRCAAR